MCAVPPAFIETGASVFELRLLGPVQAIRDGQELPLGGPRQRAVLALLVLEAGRVVPAGRLVEELWRGDPPPGAAKTLRSHISRVRAVLRPDAELVARGGGYALVIEAGQLDGERFEGLFGAGQVALGRGEATVAAERFKGALALWRGRALADVLDIAPLALESRRLEELRLTALEGRIEAELDLGLHAQLVGELETLVAEHPLRERLWRQLVLALYRCERQADALATYRRARDLLAGELGLEPSEELRQLEQAVLRQQVPPVAQRPGQHNLPAQLTSFVGREHELAELERLLPQGRLLTLTGVGGVGKTRLALELATRVVNEFPGGVWLVDLSGVANAALIPQQIAPVLGLRESPDLPLLELLGNHFRKLEALLLLDNCEHLLPACAELVEALLRGASALRILATSREAIGVAGELEYPLVPLAVPSAAADPEETTDTAAVRLFLERSSATHDVAATPRAIATVARICRELDGIPLALELAAARTRTLSVDEIAAHLDDRFGFLKYWRHVAVPRHQTLEATMNWSYELLSEAEREVLRSLSVFAGGFTLRTAAAVCGGVDEAKALDLVGRLVERSLVVVDLREGEARYRLLETVRQYASERLAEAGKVDETRRAHAATFVRVATEGSLGGEDGLSRLAVEHDNVLAALEWSLSGGDRSGPELASAYGRFWLSRGQLQEARPWLERALSADQLRDELRAELLCLLGAVLRDTGDLARAEEVLSEGLHLARACANRALEARLLILQAAVRVFLDVIGYRQALGICEEAVTVLESAGDFAALADAWVEIAMLHYWLGQISSDQAALERGEAYARRSGNRAAELLAQESLARSFDFLTVPTDLAIERQEQLLEAVEGEPRSEAHVLHHLALMYGFAGRFVEARSAIRRCRAVWAESGAKLDWASTAMNAGAIELMAGDPLAAERELREGYETLLAMQHIGYRATLTLLLAESVYAQGRYEEAERLVEDAAATTIHDDLPDQVSLRIIGAKLHARCGDFEAADRLSQEARELVPSWHHGLLGEVLVGRAEVLILAGKPDEAAEALGEAARLYEKRRAEPLAERVRKQLEQLAAHSLTPHH